LSYIVLISKKYNFLEASQICTVSMAERLTRVPQVRKVESSFSKDRPRLTQRCQRFATASTSTQKAVLPWRYDAEMGTANSLHAST